MDQKLDHHPAGSRPDSTSLAIVTPSYAPDRELCGDLVRSVLQFSQENVHHHIVVPKQDLALFSSLSGDRTTIHCADHFLPRSMLRVPPINAWINVRHPYPPVRGWIAQQIIKLSLASSLRADVVLLVDSDIVLIRPFSGSTFTPSGSASLFRVDAGIDGSLPRHRLWHQTARRLLGLPPDDRTVLPDYICCPCVWVPDVVRSMLTRIERETGTDWATAVGAELHFSEMILYGVFIEEVFGLDGIDVTADMRCLNHYEEVPLDAPALDDLLVGVRPTDVAVMISAKSRTLLADRRRALQRFSVADR
ncbi:hypothetical protein ASF21_09635 [Arthrobacter sp. Leaf234]|uniref:DUF6492 family protein n=1 Tax=Arthrobacter sp. Leaf234 TaxID=1736303 RepID=UPI0006FB09AB|nr:DUF6492 family protein [Arthrobacter sp. Leaf234]KQO01824.1 hypothetical protein ASF21_09635 [Arthrobacter sp. Leaf234]